MNFMYPGNEEKKYFKGIRNLLKILNEDESLTASRLRDNLRGALNECAEFYMDVYELQSDDNDS